MVPNQVAMWHSTTPPNLQRIICQIPNLQGAAYTLSVTLKSVPYHTNWRLQYIFCLTWPDAFVYSVQHNTLLAVPKYQACCCFGNRIVFIILPGAWQPNSGSFEQSSSLQTERCTSRLCCYPFTPKSDQFHISPAASQERIQHRVWRTCFS